MFILCPGSPALLSELISSFVWPSTFFEAPFWIAEILWGMKSFAFSSREEV